MKKEAKKCFLISLCSTLFILSLITGFLIVEKNTRNIVFENDAPFLEVKKNKFAIESMKIHFMGKDFILNFK